MINGKSVLAVITARGGSKGLPRKNILEVNGRPLLAWSSAAAGESRYIDRVILSSDDDEIIRVGKEWGCEAPFKRPLELAHDETSTEHALIHALDNIEETYDYIVLLQPTSPLRLTEDIDSCIKLCHERRAPACVTVSKTEKSPYWMFQIDDNGRMTPFLEKDGPWYQRQNLPSAYAANGAVYVADVEWYRENQTFYGQETVAHVMPPERSVDVDTELDLMLVETIMEANGRKGE